MGRLLHTIFALEKFVVIFLVIVVGRFALERGQRQSVFVEDARRLQIVDELVVLLERTDDLLPCDELRHLFRKLPELLEVNVTVWQSES